MGYKPANMQASQQPIEKQTTEPTNGNDPNNSRQAKLQASGIDDKTKKQANMPNKQNCRTTKQTNQVPNKHAKINTATKRRPLHRLHHRLSSSRGLRRTRRLQLLPRLATWAICTRVAGHPRGQSTHPTVKPLQVL